MDYRDRIASILEQKGLSQNQIARKSGVSRSNISTLLADHSREMAFSAVAALARALGVSLDWLATGEMWERDALAPDEDTLLALYRQLPGNLRELALDTLKGFARAAKQE